MTGILQSSSTVSYRLRRMYQKKDVKTSRTRRKATMDTKSEYLIGPPFAKADSVQGKSGSGAWTNLQILFAGCMTRYARQPVRELSKPADRD